VSITALKRQRGQGKRMKPVPGVLLGDAAGIGPEIAAGTGGWRETHAAE